MNRKLKLWELNRLDEATFKNQKKFPITVVLDDIRSYNNVGSFFRTADAFNIEKIYLCGITPQPPHREIHKTALGATETVEWEYRVSILELVKELKSLGKCICSIEQAEETLHLNKSLEIQDQELVLVFGNEVHGVHQEVIDFSDYVVEIPQFGTKHSLNVSVCAGVVLWEFVRNKEI
jgi:23S rRNA (guanosine2251-2'-O)-methyltransferase